MNTMGMSKKMLDSNKYKRSDQEMREAFIVLREQLKFVERIVNNNETLRRKGYEQYRTYSNNKRSNKMTTIPCNPVGSNELFSLIYEIDKFFAWEEEHKKTRREKEKEMYKVVGYDLLTGRKTEYAEITDPAKAYELAHELDAACNLGRDDEDPPTDKLEHPSSIQIEDEDGNDVWQECSEARCPVTVGLFQ